MGEKTVFRGILSAAVCAGAVVAQQMPAAAWQHAADALVNQPGLLRFYSFKTADVRQPDLAGGTADMLYRPDGGTALTTETGRVADKSAVVLDGGCFEASALLLPNNAFTVSLWVRPIGTGVKTGNSGSVNGMIVCNGSGYYDGWRLVVYDWKSCRPTLDIGNPQGSFSVRAADSLSAGFWNHLAVTWDGARVRIFINGMLSVETPYDGAVVQPKAPLKIGFAGFGVGSLKMAVDEFAVFDRALPAEAVASLSLPGTPLPETLKPLVRQLQETGAEKKPTPAFEAAHQALGRAISEMPEAAVWKAWSDLSAARLSVSPDGTPTVCMALFENTALPAHLRGQTVATLAQAARNGAALPSRILVKLPEFMELDADGQRQFALSLADAYARETDLQAASGVFEHLLAFSGALPRDTAEVRQAYARLLCQSGRFDAAREQYAAVQSDPRLPVYVRGIAALSAAQLWRVQDRFTQAAQAFRTAAVMTNQPPHLRLEAEACAAECDRQAAGKPARDPEVTRQRPSPLPAPAVVYFVAPDGDDDADGSIKKPFASLERARDAIRAQKKNGVLTTGGATVYLRGGTYTVTNTFTLTEIDSGDIGAPVVYRAWQDEKPVFNGGFRVRRLWKVRDPSILARLPAEARGHVRVADLRAQGYGPFDAQKSYGYGLANKTVRELFEDGEPLPIARWPNDDSLKIGAVLDTTNHIFVCATNRLARWTQASDLMANGYWLYLWAGCTVPVAAVDPAAGTIRLQEKPGYGMKEGRPFYLLNLLEEIDRPGEWYLDRANGRLYVWPLKHPWFTELIISRWDKPFIQADKAEEIVFQGLTFEYGQQQGLVLNQCVNVIVADCIVRRLGGTAITAVQNANLKVYGNILHTLGHTGIHVSGGNRRNLTSGQILIENNDVHHFGRCSRTYNPAVLLEGCGARVAHNHFHHAPSSAMRIEGNDHLIEFNQVDHVVQESDDQGGIDMWGNPSYRGVIIRFNRWQDIGGGDIPCGQAGIRFDDAISGTLVYGNLFERTSNGHFGGVQIHGGKHNIVDNNVFVDCHYGVSFSPWGQKRWEAYLNRPHVQDLLYREVNIRTLPYSRRYPELADINGPSDVNSIWRNLFAGSEQTFFRKTAAVDEWANQTFASLSNRTGRIAQPPFRPLPLDEIGLYADPLRATE